MGNPGRKITYEADRRKFEPTFSRPLWAEIGPELLEIEVHEKTHRKPSLNSADSESYKDNNHRLSLFKC